MEQSNNSAPPPTSFLPGQGPDPDAQVPSSSSSSSIEQQQQLSVSSYRVNISLANSMPSSEMRDDIWSCLVILLTFWFFASMTLILGFYGSVELLLGPNCSRLLQANSIFVQDIKVTAGADSKPAPMLHGFLRPPPLDVQATWSEIHNVSVPANFHKEWIYYLNEEAQINVSYSVKSEASCPLTLIIAQGKESLIQWIENPSHPNTTLSWNQLHGKGMIQQNIVKPSDYYVAVGNINNQEVEVRLEFKVRTLLYNTTGAYYECSVDQRLCILKLFFLRANVAILTTSGPQQAEKNDGWYVKLSYGPRWITYFVGSGVMTVVILLAFKICTNLQFNSGYGASHQTAESTTERSPLLLNKDDDSSSLGSSYDSVSHDDEDIEEWFESTSGLLKDSETGRVRHLCAICCDAQRDCFFLPCGHCTTCFACGTRITNEASACPICRRKMKKIRKIFTV